MNLDLLQKWRRGKVKNDPRLGSAEYRAKYHFMTDFVAMLHEMGAHEFARQYEWSTCKSQPNCLKRKDSGDAPDKGLTAVDFRAGLVLLPYLPMSPGDFKLIARGVGRGSLVQFDRGNLDTLKQYMEAHPKEFADMWPLYEELVDAEQVYRNSVPDITHNGLRLLYSGKLWSQIRRSSITGWRVTNVIDKACEASFLKSPLQALVFVFMSLLGLAGKAVALGGLVAGIGSVAFSWPLMGAAALMLVDGLVLSAVCRAGRKFLGHADWRRHYQSLATQPAYFKKALQGKVLESTVRWLRAGRITPETAAAISTRAGTFLKHLCMSVLPTGLHHVLTDAAYAKERLVFIFVRPLRLYFDSELRNQRKNSITSSLSPLFISSTAKPSPSAARIAASTVLLASARIRSISRFWLVVGEWSSHRRRSASNVPICVVSSGASARQDVTIALAPVRIAPSCHSVIRMSVSRVNIATPRSLPSRHLP